MYDNISAISQLIKDAGFKVYQDIAPATEYPYCVYTFVDDRKKRLSNQVMAHVRQYQLSYFSTGDATDLDNLMRVLDDAHIQYEDFAGQPGQENDDTVTNYYTYLWFKVGDDYGR